MWPVSDLRPRPIPQKSLLDPLRSFATAAFEKPNQLFCFAAASRASLSCFQFGAYFSASACFAEALAKRGKHLILVARTRSKLEALACGTSIASA